MNLAKPFPDKYSLLIIFTLLVATNSFAASRALANFGKVEVEQQLRQARQFKTTAPYRSVLHSQKAIKMAQNAGDDGAVAEGKYIICTTLNGSVRYDSLHTICREALLYFEEHGNTLRQGEIKNYLGIIADIRGDKETAGKHFREAIQIFESLGACSPLANAYNNYGVMHVASKQTEKAQEFYFKALAINKQCSDPANDMISFHNIGIKLLASNDLVQAKSYLLKAEKIARETNNQFWKTTISITLAKIFNKDGDLATAKNYLKEAQKIAEENHDYYTLPRCYIQLAKMDMHRQQYAKAISYYKKAVEAQIKIGKQKGLSTIYNNIADANLEMGNLTEAQKYITLASEITGRSWANLANTYQLDARLHEAREDYERATALHRQHHIARDSAFSLKLAANIKNVERTYQLKNKESELELLNQRYELQRYIFTFAILATMFFGFVIFIFYWEKKRHNEILEKTVAERTASLQRSNEELQKFAFVASHDLKSPLRNIYGFLSLIKRKYKSPDNVSEIQEYVDFALSAAKDMNTLIEDVLEYSKLDYLESKRDPVPMREVLEHTIAELHSTPSKRQQNVTLDGEFPIIHANPTLVQQLFRNLIENGLKYNESEKPTVTISANESAEKITFDVSDNGIGIPPEYRSKVFGIFTRLHSQEQYEGTGIGLAICRKIVDHYKGNITIQESTSGGTSFQIALPSSILKA